MYKFAVTRIFETKIAGRMVAIICQCFCRVNPKEAGRMFIPHVTDVVLQLINDNNDLLKDEHADQEFLYFLLLLSEVRSLCRIKNRFYSIILFR